MRACSDSLTETRITTVPCGATTNPAPVSFAPPKHVTRPEQWYVVNCSSHRYAVAHALRTRPVGLTIEMKPDTERAETERDLP